jgi:hypothetical protein
MFGTWTLTWFHWFHVRIKWISKVAGLQTLLYIGAQFLNSTVLSSVIPHPVRTGAHAVSLGLRLLFLLLTALILYWGIRIQRREGWLSLPAALLISIGLFAPELSALHIPGIWFPFGTGVSRTQFAYAAFDVVLFALLLGRQLFFARQCQYSGSDLANSNHSVESLAG